MNAENKFLTLFRDLEIAAKNHHSENQIDKLAKKCYKARKYHGFYLDEPTIADLCRRLKKSILPNCNSDWVKKLYAEMYELYLYEIFGFFSTTVRKEKSGLPVNIFCPNTSLWCLEEFPVICFQNDKGERANRHNVLKLTMEENPKLLDEECECVLNDEELARVKDFISENLAAIKEHLDEITSSSEFLEQLKFGE